jgi:hypothetical protein
MWHSVKNNIKPERARKENSQKMVGVESNIEIEAEVAGGQLVCLVFHDKDNKAEIELLAEDRWVSHGMIVLMRNSMKAMVLLEGTCKAKEEEAIRKEIVAKFA